MNVEDLILKCKQDFVEEFKANKICAMGIGGTGARIVTQIYHSNITDVSTMIVNTGQKTMQANKIFLLQNGILGEHADTEGFVDIGRALIESQLDRIMTELRKYDYIFLIAALGGGLGTGGMLEVLKKLKAEALDKYVVTVVIMPFTVESRVDIAMEYINQIKALSQRFILVDNNNFVKDETASFSHVLQRCNDHIVKLIANTAKFLEKLKVQFLADLIEDIEIDIPSEFITGTQISSVSERAQTLH